MKQKNTKRIGRAAKNLAKHAARMNALIAQGMDRLAASKQAYDELCAGKLRSENLQQCMEGQD